VAEEAVFAGDTTTLTYAYLKSGAEFLLKEAEETIDGNVYTSMMALISTAFFIEAYLNHIGEKLIAHWDVIERKLSPSNKLDVVALALKVDLSFGSRPFESFSPIFKFRNLLAHGRTATIGGTWKRNLGSTSQGLRPLWLQLSNPEEARRRFDDGVRIVEYLHEAAGLGSDPFSLMSHGRGGRIG